MRTGKYGALVMTSPPPEMRDLDTRMAETLVYARIMEFQSIELEVSSMRELFLSQANDICRGVPQGVLFEHNPLAFYSLLEFIAGMRKEACCTERSRRPVQSIRLSRTDLPDSMVRRLVEKILMLPPKPRTHETMEILEMQKVDNHPIFSWIHAGLTCVL
jgi:hypothetical protein